MIRLVGKMSNFEDIIREACSSRDIAGAVLVGGDSSGMHIFLIQQISWYLVFISMDTSTIVFEYSFNIVFKAH